MFPAKVGGGVRGTRQRSWGVQRCHCWVRTSGLHVEGAVGRFHTVGEREKAVAFPREARMAGHGPSRGKPHRPFRFVRGRET